MISVPFLPKGVRIKIILHLNAVNNVDMVLWCKYVKDNNKYFPYKGSAEAIMFSK